VDQFLKEIVIPVLVVIPANKVRDIYGKSREEIHKELESLSTKVSEQFFNKLSSKYPTLNNIHIKLFILPLGNFEDLVNSFEKKIKRTVGKYETV
jgi:hypothetical protein